MLRLLLFFSALLVMIVVGSPVQVLLRRMRRTRAADAIQIGEGRLLCRLLRLQVTARGALPATRPVLVVANHVSWTDILALASLAPLCFVAKSEVAAWPGLGFAVRAHGTLFVPRRRTKAMPLVNARIAHALGQSRAVVLFPEGTTGNGRRLEAFHSGHLEAVAALLNAQPLLPDVAIVPVALAYTRVRGLPVAGVDRSALAWFGDMPLLPHVRFLLRSGPIHCEVIWGEPAAFRRGDDRKQVMAGLRRRVHRAFSALVGGIADRREAPVLRTESAVCSCDPEIS